MVSVQSATSELSLRTRFAATPIPLTDETRDALRGAICAFVDARKSEGDQPEQVIVALKRIAAEAGHTSSHLRPSGGSSGTLNGTNYMLSEMVRWCIVHYYADAD